MSREPLRGRHPEPRRLVAAMRYALAGWPVFPLAAGEKVPIRGSGGFKDATTDPDRIERWFGERNGGGSRNIGIATGAPGPDVLDVDRHGEASGFKAYNRLVREGLVPQAAAIVRTPSGGFHAYFAGTDQRSGSLAAEHVDFRAQGGYVVAPPSQVGGRRYEVISHQPAKEAFDWTAAREHLQPQTVRAQVERREDGRPRSLAHLPGWVASQPEGNRNAGLFWAANRAVEAGDTETLDALHKAAEAAGLPAREVSRTIRSAQQQERPSPEPRPFPEQARPAAAEPERQLEHEPAEREAS